MSSATYAQFPCRRGHVARTRRTSQRLARLVCVAALALGAAAPASASADSILNSGEMLSPGQHLAAPNSQYSLYMQGDGNLVMYTQAGRVLWHSRTNGNPGARAVMQTDGNFVVYSTDNRPLFNTGTQNHPGAHVDLQSDGNLVMYGGGGAVLWHTSTVNGRLAAGETLNGGQYLTAKNGEYRLVMQHDGNLVLYRTKNTVALWHSRTNGNPGARAVMQGDGNVVVYSTDNRPLFNTGTQNHPGSRLEVQTDGNVVIYNSTGSAVWNTGTAQSTSSPAAEAAITWALNRVGSQAYNGWCAKFVAHAYGQTAFGYNTAWDGAKAWGLRPGSAPRGALVFFAPHRDNGNAGHVGISLGDGRMVSAESSGVKVGSYGSGYWGGLYRGWTHPPARWTS